VQPEIGLAGLVIEAVTFETAITQERPDVALEADFGRIAGDRRTDQGAENEQRKGADRLIIYRRFPVVSRNGKT